LSAFFAASGFPAGTWHMKQVRLKDRTLASLWEEPDVTKRAAILPLLAAYPERQFILLGDAGERDPEIYGEIARAHPAQVRHIYIRLLPGRDEDPLRWAAAFAGLPADRWTLLP
jgi:phosphatidate phosphatase APP1